MAALRRHAGRVVRGEGLVCPGCMRCPGEVVYWLLKTASMKSRRILVIIGIVVFAANSVYQTWEIHQLTVAVRSIDADVSQIDMDVSDISDDVKNIQGDTEDLPEIKTGVESVADKLNAN